MSWIKDLFTRTPDKVVPMLQTRSGTLNNEYYGDTSDLKEQELLYSVFKFIAKEFTKVKITIPEEMPNAPKVNYLLNLKPNNSQTANDLLYTFAHGLIQNGVIWYRLSSNSKAPTALYISETQIAGYTAFTKPYLMMRRPRRILKKYAELLSKLSTERTDKVTEIHTKLKKPIEKRDKDGNLIEDSETASIEEQIESRLGAVNSEVQKYGMFITQQGEEAKDHPNFRAPDSAALENYKTLIYEEYNINQKILQGSYNEEDYRAFKATHLEPLANALEELLNFLLVDYNSYTSGLEIHVIMNLLQFSTLDSFRQFAQNAVYYGWMNNNDVRVSMGLPPIKGDAGKLYYTNANAKRVTNPDGSLYVAPVTDKESLKKDKKTKTNLDNEDGTDSDNEGE